MVRYLVPLGIFAVMVAFFVVGLGKDPRELPSVLVGKPTPKFNLPELHKPQETFSPDEMLGKVWLMNVWASWCPSCRAEHPLFMQLSRQGKVNIVGFNYKDRRQDALQWLGQLGDPYSNIPADLSGDVAIDFGVYGAPETYVIDKQGIIRHRYAGAVSHQYWRETLEPMIRELEQQ